MQVIQESCVQLVPVLLSHLKEKWLLKEMIATFTTIQHVPRVMHAFLDTSLLLLAMKLLAFYGLKEDVTGISANIVI